MVGAGASRVALAGTVSGPFDLVRGWSGGPWDYQYPWAGRGYPVFGFGSPYTWDQPLGAGQAGPYIWGAPFASPSLYLPEESAPSEPPSEPPSEDAERQAQPAPEPMPSSESAAPSANR